MHRDDRSGSCRSLSPPFAKRGHYNCAVEKLKKPELCGSLRISAALCVEIDP